MELKRIGALLLAGSFLLTMLGGCKVADKETESSQVVGVESSALDETEKDTPNSSDEEPEEDLSSYTIWINEIMPSNHTTLADENGDFLDWVEIYNYGTETLDLTGCKLLVNDKTEEILSTTEQGLLLHAKETLLILCHKGMEPFGNHLTAGISLPKEGGRIGLQTPQGQLIDLVEYEEVKADQSLIREEESLVEAPFATPGYANNREGDLLFKAADLPCRGDGNLVINEVLVRNDEWFPVDKVCYDLVEVKNVSDHTIDLSEYYLSDKEAERDKAQLPKMELESGGIYLIYCFSEDDPYPHLLEENVAAFGLSATEESLYLTDHQGNLIDYVYLKEIPMGGSMGRKEGENGFFYFEKATPGEENGEEGALWITKGPQTSLAQGIYDDVESVTIELTSAEDDCQIYYTMDGMFPTTRSILYEGPIVMEKTSVIRAITVKEGALIGQPSNYSYIINEHHTLPVTSVMCNGSDFEKIYRLELWEALEAAVAYFDNQPGMEGFDRVCTIEMHGATSRETGRKKSFKLEFDSAHGGDIEYPLFEGNPVTTFKSLILRGGVWDNLDTIRDQLAYDIGQNACNQIPGETKNDLYGLATRYTVLYVNGVYKGIYSWREDYSRTYVANRAGVDKEGVTILRQFTDNTPIGPLMDYMTTYSMSNPEYYHYAAERFDMESLAYWMAVQAYFDNRDVYGNVRYIQETPESKWKVALFDLDYSLTWKTVDWSTVISFQYELGSVINCLLTNREFCDLLLQCTANLYHHGFDPETVHGIMDQYLEILTDEEVARDCELYGCSFLNWKAYMANTYTYTEEERTISWIDSLVTRTGASPERVAELFGDYKGEQ